MRVIDFYTNVEKRTGITTSERSVLLSWLNQIQNFICSSFNYNFLIKDAFIATVAPYETGTVTATNGSATIGGIGTTFTAAMVGRKFRKGTDSAWYRIKTYTNATTIALDRNYTGTTDATGTTYSIFQDEYLLAPDLDKSKNFLQLENEIVIAQYEVSALDTHDVSPDTTGEPRKITFLGINDVNYTAGTLSGTTGTKVLTGNASALWATAEGLGRMTKILIGDNVYHVDSVDSATQITLIENIITTLAAGTTYIAILDNIKVRIWPIPDDTYNIPYKYFRVAPVLSDNNDIPIIPEKWHFVLEDGLVWRGTDYQGKANMPDLRNQFLMDLQMMKAQESQLSTDIVYPMKSFDEILGQRIWVKFPSNYDYRAYF